ncbi:MAG: GTP-binding protein [Patescibacteria group bacterium]
MKKIRNVAVIAHVDHGKTTLIDALLKQTNTFRDNQKEMAISRILDSNDQERERGITITAKNCAIDFAGTRINIIDTPGHVDFSSEVERTLGMADGALLIIDAQEGPMPQTRFVLRKALELGLKIIVLINKIDKQYAQVPLVIEKTESLFLDLAQEESQLDFPILYSIGRDGQVFESLPDDFSGPADVSPLLKKIIDFIPAPKNQDDLPFKMLVSSFEHDNHLGRILIGRIHQGKISQGQKITLIQKENSLFFLEKIFVAQGLSKEEVKTAASGEIVFLAGVNEAKIGDTVAAPGQTKILPAMKIGEPTLHITIQPNKSPFSGQEGDFSTANQLEERLQKEVETNLSLQVAKTGNGKFRVAGKGELHLTVFLEELRRDGYELEVEKPEVIIKEVDGVKMEPVEELNIVVPTEYVGVVSQELGRRYAVLVNTTPVGEKETEFVYHLPTRALIGLRSLLVAQTKGSIIFNSQMIDYQPLGKSIKKLRSGALVAAQSGKALSYGLNAAQSRGITFIGPGTQVYKGMIVGKNSKEADIEINVCKGKKLTNMRSKSSDGIIQLVPPTPVTLEMGLEFIENDELMEITPKNVRLRKKAVSREEKRRLRQNNLAS